MATLQCEKCSKEISSDGVKANGKAYHSDCFVCCKCSKSFTDGFVTVEGKSFHQDCIPSNVEIMTDTIMDMKLCDKCDGPLDEGGFVEANSVFYHPDCFRCVLCKQKITQGAFIAVENGLAHEKCVGNPTCSVCRSEITSKALIVDGKHFCVACFSCFGCGKPIEGGFTLVDNRYYHPNKDCVPADAGYDEMCPACNEVLSEPAVEIEGKRMHRACLKCSKCDKPFEGLDFGKLGNDYVHKECVQ